MSKRKENFVEEENGRAAAAVRKKRRIRVTVTVTVMVLLLTAAIVLLAMLYWNTRNALTEAEMKLKLREDTITALEGQVEEQKLKIEDILNVEEAEPVITSDQIKEMLSSASELVTQKYVYTNAARREASKTWLWGWTLPFSNTSLLVTYDGEIKAGIDFSEIEVEVTEDTRTITVTLPSSKVLNNNIPQETIQVLEVRNNLFNEITFDDYNEFIGAEKPVMQEKAIEMGLLDDADREAAAMIKALLSLLPGMDTYKLNIVTK